MRRHPILTAENVGRTAGLAAGSAFTVCADERVRIMALTVKKHHKLVRAGKAGLYLDGGTSGVRGLYLVVEHKRNASWSLRYQLDKTSTKTLFMDFHRSVAKGLLYERSRSLRIDRKDRPRTDSS
jgi:hypothetical protein